MRVAAIDLGTNSFLCLIAEVAEGTTGAAAGSSGTRTLKKIYDISRVVRLGEKVHTNRFFLPEALKRAEVALDEFQKVIREYPVDKVIATATSAARDATNGEALMKLGRDRGIPIYVIEGSREAELSFEGAISGISNAAQKNITKKETM